jgi:putative GTP pyrophosphokinase
MTREVIECYYDMNEQAILDCVELKRCIRDAEARLKYDRYYPDHQTGKVLNDMLGFRTLCDNYEEVIKLDESEYIRVADMSAGKVHDDGYRGVHVYFQLDYFHYPIEIQYNTYYDRQLNNWLHKYFYKKTVFFIY